MFVFYQYVKFLLIYYFIPVIICFLKLIFIWCFADSMWMNNAMLDLMQCAFFFAFFLLFWVRYCECFASGVYCDGCNCNNCHNNVENEPARREAVEATLERNPHAFRPKIASSPHGARDNKVLFEIKLIHRCPTLWCPCGLRYNCFIAISL